MSAYITPFDPKFDLLLERTTDVPVELVWKAWTDPEQLKQWWTPAPWTTVEAEIDLQPGGIFRTVMQSPEGEKHNNLGSYLEVIPNERLIWTGALKPGFRPQATSVLGEILFTVVTTFEKTATGGTKYTAQVMHQTEEHKVKHDDMGFQAGWGAAWAQLVAMVKAGQAK